jgi:hypothetical protein
MPGLPLILETLSPKATLTLASMTVAAEGLNKFTSAEISPSPHVVEIVLEAERRVAGDQRRLIVVGEIAPQAADDEELHHGTFPGLHGVAAKRKAVDVGPGHGQD